MLVYDNVHGEQGEVLEQRRFGYTKCNDNEVFVDFEDSGLRIVSLEWNQIQQVV